MKSLKFDDYDIHLDTYDRYIKQERQRERERQRDRERYRELYLSRSCDVG